MIVVEAVIVLAAAVVGSWLLMVAVIRMACEIEWD